MSYEEEMERLRQQRSEDALRESTADTPLFAPLTRASDPQTSQDAADRIMADLSELQLRVYRVFLVRGRLTAKQAEKLPEFKDLGFSTVRKRTSELARAGWLKSDGVMDGCTAYRAVVPKDCG